MAVQSLQIETSNFFQPFDKIFLSGFRREAANLVKNRLIAGDHCLLIAELS